MSKTLKRFDYQMVKTSKEDLMPFTPFVYIKLGSWISDDSDAPIISPHLVSDGEIDYQIQALKADLDAVGKSAKAALRLAPRDE
jgi:hypothetical protein